MAYTASEYRGSAARHSAAGNPISLRTMFVPSTIATILYCACGGLMLSRPIPQSEEITIRSGGVCFSASRTMSATWSGRSICKVWWSMTPITTFLSPVEHESRGPADLYGAFPVKRLFLGFPHSSLFGAGKAVLRPVACDQVPGARGRGQGTETLSGAWRRAALASLVFRSALNA